MFFGERTGNSIRLLATRPIPCEHRFGPSFALSDTDEAALRVLLEDFKSDPELAPLEILGCYFSHSRHGAALTERDVDLCDRHFTQPGQFAVVLVPSLSGDVRGVLLARDSQGSFVASHEFEYSTVFPPRREIVRAQAPPSDTTVSRLKTAARLNVALSAPTPHRDPEPVMKPAAPVDRMPAAVSLPAPDPPVARWTLDRWKARFPIRLNRAGLAAAALVVLLCWPSRTDTASQLRLALTDHGRELIIHWDPDHAAIREGMQGTLDIRDGEQQPVHISIGNDLIRRGWIPYQRASDLVRISLTLAGPGINLAESAIYFAPSHRVSDPTPAVTTTPVKADSIESPVQEPQIVPGATNGDPLLTKTVVTRPPRVFQAPIDRPGASANLTMVRSAILPEPPAFRLEPGMGGPALQPALNLSLPAPRPTAVTPASGWLIWTGKLPKRSMLSLSAQGASLGYLSGWIPQNTHVAVHPGELVNGGMVVFTTDPNRHSEAPSARNGWNTVVYKLDYERATELEVIDSPGPSNNWSQLTLRNGSSALSLIVLEWQAQ